MLKYRYIHTILLLTTPAMVLASDPAGYIVFLYIPLLLISITVIPLLWAATKEKGFNFRKKIMIRVLSVTILWSPIPHAGFDSWTPASLVVVFPPYTEINKYFYSIFSIVVSSLILYYLVKTLTIHNKIKRKNSKKNNV